MPARKSYTKPTLHRLGLLRRLTPGLLWRFPVHLGRVHSTPRGGAVW